MLLLTRILISAIVLGASAVSLSACGQQGPLYLPTEPAASKRATLPETLLRAVRPNAPTAPSPVTPPAPAAIPAPQ